jgi:nucleotide-binding universal stress UspA family protein
MVQKILVAIDLSKIAEYVFEQALDLAKSTGASLMILHVLSPDEEGSPAFSVFSSICHGSGENSENLTLYQKQWELFTKQGLELVRSHAQKAMAAGVRTEFDQIPGKPGQVICDLASNWKADLIVVGCRGHSGFNKLILGSVSNYVLHHAPCSVLTVQVPVKSKPQSS